MKSSTLFVIGCVALALLAVPLHACDHGLPRQSSVEIYGAAAAPAAPCASCASCAAAAATAVTPQAAVVRVEKALSVVEAPRTVEVQRLVVPAAPIIYQAAPALAVTSYSRSVQRGFAVASYAPVVRQRVLAPRAVVVQRAPAVVVRQRAVAVKAQAADVTVVQRRGLFGRNVTKVRVR